MATRIFSQKTALTQTGHNAFENELEDYSKAVSSAQNETIINFDAGVPDCALGTASGRIQN
jgi:hypothetical protein